MKLLDVKVVHDLERKKNLLSCRKILAALLLMQSSCSVLNYQKAANVARLEAICLYENNLSYGSKEFEKCILNEEK